MPPVFGWANLTRSALLAHFTVEETDTRRQEAISHRMNKQGDKECDPALLILEPRLTVGGALLPGSAAGSFLPSSPL